MAFTRIGELQVIATYDTGSVKELIKDWNNVKTANFCPDGECPFALKKEARFDWDASKFLYYRARAITANVANGNGDLFPHAELEKSYRSFIGKGVYYNHQSDDPLKAFGVILDAAWSPHHAKRKSTDQYIEILGSIDKELIELKRPGMLRQIEAGILLSTSMGCVCERAQCSVCSNIATVIPELCAHMDPGSMFYTKGKLYDREVAHETNYGITFTEDSFVPQPADSTAHVFEIYANKKEASLDGAALGRLGTHFEHYWKGKTAGKEVPTNAITPTETTLFRNAQDVPPPPPPPPVDQAPEEESAATSKKPEDLHGQVADQIEKKLEQRLKQIIDDEIRKVMGPKLQELEKEKRPEVQQEVAQQAPDSLPDADPAALPAAPSDSLPPAPPTAGAPLEAPLTSSKNAGLVVLTEDFNKWPPEARKQLIAAVQEGKPFHFQGFVT